MSNLDNPNIVVDESTVPFLPTVLRYGGFAGLALVVYTLVGNMTGLAIPTSMMGGLAVFALMIVIWVVVAILVIKYHRDKQLGGNISFGRAFVVSFLSLLLAAAISTLFSVLYMTVIDPGFADEAVEKMSSMFEGFGMPQDQVDAQLANMKEKFTPMGMLTQGLLWGSIFYAVVAAIVSAIMKKKPAFA